MGPVRNLSEVREVDPEPGKPPCHFAVWGENTARKVMWGWGGGSHFFTEIGLVYPKRGGWGTKSQILPVVSSFDHL